MIFATSMFAPTEFGIVNIGGKYRGKYRGTEKIFENPCHDLRHVDVRTHGIRNCKYWR